jgi:hypothetical protein
LPDSPDQEILIVTEKVPGSQEPNPEEMNNDDFELPSPVPAPDQIVAIELSALEAIDAINPPAEPYPEPEVEIEADSFAVFFSKN